MLPETQFPFLAEKGHVVSLVGGGGKTTLLYAFARHCAAKGWRVLVSTTTHIRQPGENYAADEATLASLWAAGQYAVAGVPAEQGKLTALPPEQLTCWMARADMVLLDFCRKHRCYSVKRGCESGNCGLCTVLLDGKPVLSCSVLAARVDGRSVTTLEGLQEEAAEFGAFIAEQGAEQCGFCNPGFIMNALALFREKPDPNEEEIKEYLAGNLCRCSGYEGQLRGIQNFLAWKKSKEAAQ